MEDWNPLDWTAEPFLTLFVALSTAVLAVLGLWRTRLGGPAVPGGATTTGLGVLHLAYLSGGAGRAADTALVGLLEAGAATPDRKRGVMQFDPATPVPTEFQPFRHVSNGESSRQDFLAEFDPRWQRLHDDLAKRGLAPNQAQTETFQLNGMLLLCAPLLMGVCKVMVGLSRDRPVGILTVLLLVTGAIGFTLLTKRPCRNRAGAAALAAAQQDHARAARAPLPTEMALAFALTGTDVLASRSYRWALSSGSSSSSDSSSSSSDGGGDGGGGCGGCSG